jgi:FkbM family methyltransferase
MAEQVGAAEPSIDYVRRWRQLVEARVAQGRRLDRQHGLADEWAGGRAERFRRMAAAARAGEPNPLIALLDPWLRPETRVLDVGAGAGRHVLSVAPRVQQVTAVEPSPAMREQLALGVAEAGLTNVTVVPAAWPDAEVEPADVVICSHVVYFVADIEAFMRRLRAATRRVATVVVRYQQRELPTLELFQRIWGEPRCLEPTFADLYGVACQLHLWAHASPVPFSGGQPLGFSSLEQAVNAVRADLLNPQGPEAERIIREYLNERLINRGGTYVWDQRPTYAGVLWWEETS